AAQAGAVLPLVLGDLRGHLGQLGDLMPGRLGVAGAGPPGQRLAAALTAVGDEGDGAREALGRRPPLGAGRGGGAGGRGRGRGGPCRWGPWGRAWGPGAGWPRGAGTSWWRCGRAGR